MRRPGWFALFFVFAVLTFVIEGPAGGVMAVLAIACFIVGAFRSLRVAQADDRAAITGLFGGWF
jgi:hypothetical protein